MYYGDVYKKGKKIIEGGGEKRKNGRMIVVKNKKKKRKRKRSGKRWMDECTKSKKTVNKTTKMKKKTAV